MVRVPDASNGLTHEETFCSPRQWKWQYVLGMQLSLSFQPVRDRGLGSDTRRILVQWRLELIQDTTM